MTWTINYKGITGVPGTLQVDETTLSASGLNTSIVDAETGNTKTTVFDGVDELTYADCYGEMYVYRNDHVITNLTAEAGAASLSVSAIQDGDLIVCTTADGTTKRERQQIKLGIAQIKRKALMSSTPNQEVYYRTNNVFETDDLPTVYNTNTTLTDNPNTGGLVIKRPWTV